MARKKPKAKMGLLEAARMEVARLEGLISRFCDMHPGRLERRDSGRQV